MPHTLRRTTLLAAVLAASITTTTGAQHARPASSNLQSDSSPSVQAQPGISPALAAVLARSCAECHSNARTSRWYTRVPPFSTLMARGANEGRKAVNFSEWSRYSSEQQQALLLASCNDAKLGTMPGKSYLRVRSDARLSAADVETICTAARPSTPPDAAASSRGRHAP